MKKIFLVIAFVMGISAAFADEENSFINTSDSPLQFFAELEQGVVKVLNHTFQSGQNGSNFNFVTQGGQEILFPVSRVKAGFELGGRHLFSVLYQPLTVETKVTFREDVTVDGVTFASGIPMELKYGFPFWRFTYGYDFFSDKAFDLYAGLSLQLRNASIVFAQTNGAKSTTNQNLGPVPALFVAGNYRLGSGITLGFEATGLYASSAIINGATFEFEGSILDASLRVGYELDKGVETFLNVRYLGGSAVGVSEYEDRYWTQATEDYTSNILSTLFVTAGLKIR